MGMDQRVYCRNSRGEERAIRMLRVNQVKLKPGHDPEQLRKKTAETLGIPLQEVLSVKIVRQSVDARKKPEILYSYSVDAAVKNEGRVLHKFKGKENLVSRSDTAVYSFPPSGTRRQAYPTVIVGTGPAGLFCGYFLALHGYRPILLERGKRVEERQRDVEAFWETGELNPASNVQFGEGGAGTFSDGKLNTLVKDKDGRNGAVLQTFVKFGADEKICYEAKPHMGTDVLRDVVRRMREEIIRLGGEVRFESQVTDICLEDCAPEAAICKKADSGPESDTCKKAGSDLESDTCKKAGSGLESDTCKKADSAPEAAICPERDVLQGFSRRVTGVIVNGKELLRCGQLVLAVGHSARDTFQMLYERRIPMEAKAFAVGFRVQHPQSMINESQYGVKEPGELGAAAYKVTAKGENGRAVYSFCMCPGGYVVNASSEPGMTAVNGMSYSDRAGQNANSAVIVAVTPEDFAAELESSGAIPEAGHPLAGIEFQRLLEKRAYDLCGGRIPMQRYGDFKECVQAAEELAAKAGDAKKGEAGSVSDRENGNAAEERFTVDPMPGSDIVPQCRGLCRWADLSGILPPGCSSALVDGMEAFGRQIRGFDRPDAILLGVESRTSSPVRISRDETLQSQARGLYPCGEGAGYAGGITSAAMDGIRVAEAIAGEYAPFVRPLDFEDFLPRGK